MRCPYCLEQVEAFLRDTQKGVSHCPQCRTMIPRAWLQGAQDLRATVGVVGFSGHGKTVLLTSLFSTLKRFSEFWAGYYYRSLDDYTHRLIYEQVPLFEKGVLPTSTPANFPSPAMVHYHALPVFGNAFIGYYDTAGEVFSDAAQIERAGFFVAHSDVVLFIISIPDCEPGQLDDEMSRLLDTYIRAAEDRLNADIRGKQRMVVIFTKADLMVDRLSPDLQRWLADGSERWYAIEIHDKLMALSLASLQIEEWLRDQMDCTRFPNMARDHFKEVRYTLVSALGTNHSPDSGNPDPLRVLDPFFWMLVFTRDLEKPEAKQKMFDRLMNWLAGFRRKSAALPPDTSQ
ncbi:MAG TPA: hypothetical protein ENJ82_17980 [Bacteroidetes bacterium]|nr:hypothetical protein [Bacteroidota bacterium]